MQPLVVSRQAVARLLLARQGLLSWDGGAPWSDTRFGVRGVTRTLRDLEAVQLDPVAVVARNHHFVLMNRVDDYHPEMLEGLYERKRVFEHWAQCRCVMPMEDYPLFESRRQQWKFAGRDETLVRAAEQVRAALRKSSPLPARALDCGNRVVGYWGFATKATSQAIEHLWECGEIVVARRKADERYFALAHQWLNGRVQQALPPHEELDARLRKCVRAYRVVHAGHSMIGWAGLKAPARREAVQGMITSGELTPLEVPGVKRRYAVMSQDVPLLRRLEAKRVEPRAVFLSPLDNLLWQRERIDDFFGFSYRWEIYVPPAKRKFGPYTLPILVGDRFIGRVDLSVNRTRRTLNILRMYREAAWSCDQRSAVKRALERLESRLISIICPIVS